MNNSWLICGQSCQQSNLLFYDSIPFSFHPVPILAIQNQLIQLATRLLVEDNPMVDKQRRISQRGGNSGASDAQPRYQNEGCDYRDAEADQRGVEVVFGLASAREIVGQDGVGREKHDTWRHEQNDGLHPDKLAREQPLKEGGWKQTKRQQSGESQ